MSEPIPFKEAKEKLKALGIKQCWDDNSPSQQASILAFEAIYGPKSGASLVPDQVSDEEGRVVVKHCKAIKQGRNIDNYQLLLEVDGQEITILLPIPGKHFLANDDKTIYGWRTDIGIGLNLVCNEHYC